ncbi:hypothetical protein ACRALDRAFT_1081336 [Sodiomyces alcalophilus JCM 7366]|uniref:uncharacterized protein n=1 Tax=Sodiomyces alcalophilus JCM 7366 TaxID=591952 RepID=UPI0039B43FEA
MAIMGRLRWKLSAALLLFLASSNVAHAAWDARSVAPYEEASGLALCPRPCASCGSAPTHWTNFHSIHELMLCHDQVKLLHYSLHAESPLSGLRSPIQASHYGNAVVGMYIGGRIHKQGTSAALLGQIIDYIVAKGAPESLMAQVCGSSIPADYVSGVAIDTTGEGALDRVRDSLRTWNEAGCVDVATNLDDRVPDTLSPESVWMTDSDFSILGKILNWDGPLNTTLAPHPEHPEIVLERRDEPDGWEEASWCSTHLWTDEMRNYVSDEVSKYLYHALKSENTSNWADDRWYEGMGLGEMGGNIPSGAGCGDLDGSLCIWPAPCSPSYARNWWVMTKVSNLNSELRTLKTPANTAYIDWSHYSAEILRKLPMNGNEPENPATWISILANIGNSVAVVGGGIGASNPISGAALSTLSVILSLAKDNIGQADQTPENVGLVLNTIWSQYINVLDSTPYQMFVEGDILDWPLGAFQEMSEYPVSDDDSGDNAKINRIVNFFHDRFWTYAPPTDTSLYQKLQDEFQRLIVNFVLGEGNYYIIKNGYFQSQCTEQRTGRWIKGSCYTLEHQNGGSDGKSGNSRRSQYSIPIDDEQLDFLECTMDVDFEQMYINAEDCQTKHNAYFGNATFDFDGGLKVYNGSRDSSCTASDKNHCLPLCTFNLPVLSVLTLDQDYRGVDAAQASPCYPRWKRPNEPPKAGKNYVPERLEEWFDFTNYCG